MPSQEYDTEEMYGLLDCQVLEEEEKEDEDQEDD